MTLNSAAQFTIGWGHSPLALEYSLPCDTHRSSLESGFQRPLVI